MNHRFIIGFIQGVLIAAALAAVLSIASAHATEFFPTQQAAKIAAHGKRIAWICEGKATLYYVGRRGEKTCANDRPRTEREVMPTGSSTRQSRSREIAPDSRPRPASLAGAAKPETVGLAPPIAPPPPVSLSDWQDAADSLWSFPELQEREREYMRQLLEKGKPILAQAMKEKAERLAEEAKARAAKVAEWRR